MAKEKDLSPTPIIIITMDEDHRMQIDIEEDIGIIMNDDKRKNPAAQRIYASEALTLALAFNAKELVNEGVPAEEVMTRLLESLADNLQWALDTDIKVHKIDPFSISGGNDGGLPA